MEDAVFGEIQNHSPILFFRSSAKSDEKQILESELIAPGTPNGVVSKRVKTEKKQIPNNQFNFPEKFMKTFIYSLLGLSQKPIQLNF